MVALPSKSWYAPDHHIFISKAIKVAILSIRKSIKKLESLVGKLSTQLKQLNK
jgi:hypothetical protein